MDAFQLTAKNLARVLGNLDLRPALTHAAESFIEEVELIAGAIGLEIEGEVLIPSPLEGKIMLRTNEYERHRLEKIAEETIDRRTSHD